MKHIFIVNPKSGRSKKVTMDKRIAEACTQLKLDYEIYLSTKAGESESIARNLSDDEPAIVYAVGGDGTLNEVLNGIAGSNHILSLVPMGSGNDFFRSIKDSKKDFFPCDVGKINERYFINVVCIGIDADIADNVSIMKRLPFVPASQRYNCSIFYTFSKFKFKKLQIKFGELVKKGNFTIVTVCNAGYYGGGYRIAPHALLNDGRFEIYVVEKMPKFKIPSLIFKLKKVRHEEDESVHRFTDNALEIDCDKMEVCNVDGETIKANNFRIEMINSAITFHKNTKLLEQLGIK